MDLIDRLSDAMTAAIRAGDLDEFERLALLADAAEHEREIRLSSPTALTDAAGWYARHGIAVFPLKPGQKTPRNGSAGFKDATTDPATVATWWKASPDANIGLPTGHLFDVIDIDGPAGCAAALDLRDEGLIPVVLGHVWTPRGGRHIYVPPTGDGNATRFRPGLDYRGLGGYVVAPPSIVNGRRYEWLEAYMPAVTT